MITLHSRTATIARGDHNVASTILIHVFFKKCGLNRIFRKTRNLMLNQKNIVGEKGKDA